MANRILRAGPARPPAVRPSPGRSDGDGGAVALRGDHRHLPAAHADLRGARSPTTSPTGCTVSLSAPLLTMLTDDLLKVRYAAAPRQADRAGREGDRPDQARAALPPARAHVPRPVPVAAPHLALPRRRPGARLQAPRGGRPRRGDHLDGDARLLPADGPQLGQHPGPGPRRRRSVRDATSATARAACGWASAATSPASTSSCARRPSATSSSTRTASCSPTAARCTASTPRSTARAAWPPSAATWSRPSRSGAPRRATRATSTTATSTGTSASTCRSTTSSPTSTRKGTAIYTGIKYHAITHNQLHDKWVYDPDIAARQGGPARLALPRQPREAGAAPARPHGPAAAHRQPLRRRALRPLVVRGADVPVERLPAAPLRSARRSRRSRRATTSTATTPTRWRRPARRRGAPRATTTTGSTRPTAGPTATCTSRASGWWSWRAATRAPTRSRRAPSTRRRAS